MAAPPPHGDGPPPPPRHAAPTGQASQGDSAGPPQPHTRAHSTWTAGPGSPQEEGSRRRESAQPRTPLAGGAPNAHTHTRKPVRRASVRAPKRMPCRAHSTYTSPGKSAPHPQRHKNGGTRGPTQNTPLISDAGRSTRGHQGAETHWRRRRPPTGGRGRGLRPGGNPGAFRWQRARRTCAAGGQRSHPLPRQEKGPLHRRRLVPQATPPTRPR